MHTLDWRTCKTPESNRAMKAASGNEVILRIRFELVHALSEQVSAGGRSTRCCEMEDDHLRSDCRRTWCSDRGNVLRFEFGIVSESWLFLELWVCSGCVNFPERKPSELKARAFALRYLRFRGYIAPHPLLSKEGGLSKKDSKWSGNVIN